MSKVKSESWFWAQPFYILQRATFTPVDLYTKKPLHEKPSTPEAMQTKEFQTTSTTECEYTRNFLHQRTLRRCQTALRHKKFTPDSEHVCTKNLLHKKTFNTRDALHIFTLHEEFLHQEAFTPEPFYTTRPLYINTNRLHKKTLYAEAI